MIILSAATRSLEVLLAGAVTTTELEWVSAFVDIIGGPPPTSFLSGSLTGTTAGTSPVTVVEAPGAHTQRQLKYLSLHNADTVTAVVTFRYSEGGTPRRLVRISLEASSTLFYTDGEGFRVMDDTGAILSTGSGGSSASFSILTADRAAPSDDTYWVMRTGTARGDTVTFRGRIAGTTYDLWEYTL